MAQVLVVDDSISVRKALERILKPKGVEVLPAESAKAGLEILKNYRPTLIITDVVMPEIDGFEFCKMVKDNPSLKSIPILLISGIVNPETKAQAREYKAVGIVKKPFKPDTLLYIVDLIFNKIKNVKQTGEHPAVRLTGEHPAPRLTGEYPPPKRTEKYSAPAQVVEKKPAIQAQPVQVQAKAKFEDVAFRKQLERLQVEAGLGVLWLFNTQGEILTQIGKASAGDFEVLGVQARALRKSATDISQKLSFDNFQSMLIEYEKKCLLVQGATPEHIIVGTLNDISSFSVARYVMRKKLPEIVKSLT